MKRKIMLFMIIAGLMLIILGVAIVNNNFDHVDYPSALDGYNINKFATLSTCLDENCEYQSSDLYANLSYDYDSQVLQKAIKKLNDSTSSFYSMANQSTLTPGCVAATSNQKGIRISSDYNVYSDGNVATFNIKRIKTNICTQETESYQSENFVYDFEKDKLLTLPEVKEKLNITDEELLLAIKKSNDTLAMTYNIPIVTQDNYEDVKIYYNTAGDLYVSYYVEEMKEYVSALIRERIE